MLKKLLCAAVVAASIPAVASAQDVFIAFSDTPIGIADTAFGIDNFFADSLGGAVDVLGRTNVEANVGDTLTGFVLVDPDQALSNIDGLQIGQPTNATITNLDILQFQIPTGIFGTSTRFTTPLVELVDADAATLVAANFGAVGVGPGTNLAASGINPQLADFDEGFATFTDLSDDSTFDAFLLAQFDFTLEDGGLANFDFTGGGVLVEGYDTQLFDGSGSVSFAGGSVNAIGSATGGGATGGLDGGLGGGLDGGFGGGSDGGFDGGADGGFAIPEPSSAILLVLGAAGMVARRRRS